MSGDPYNPSCPKLNEDADYPCMPCLYLDKDGNCTQDKIKGDTKENELCK